MNLAVIVTVVRFQTTEYENLVIVRVWSNFRVGLFNSALPVHELRPFWTK